jgi:hypothetical protein
MTEAMWRSVRGGAAAMLLWSAAEVAHIAWFCEPHDAWLAAQTPGPHVVLARGERVAGAGDALLVCATTHRTGPIVWHQDLDCFCAPADLTVAEVERAVDGTCRVDHATPSLGDDTGSCRFARCTHHVDRP